MLIIVSYLIKSAQRKHGAMDVWKMPVPPSVFDYAGSVIIGQGVYSENVMDRRFRAFFGTTSAVCARIWHCINIPRNAQPRHLLFSLLFLKMYGNEHQHASICSVDEKTFRKWAWYYVEQMAAMQVVRIETRISTIFSPRLTLYRSSGLRDSRGDHMLELGLVLMAQISQSTSPNPLILRFTLIRSSILVFGVR